MSMVEKIQGTARVVNYAGLVRGKTQRIIKLEDAGAVSYTHLDVYKRQVQRKVLTKTRKKKRAAATSAKSVTQVHAAEASM